uniref:NADH dehydrogenase subunit 1 n=1 Tax=Kudoa iwatai TaxID=269814 RepID=A0A0H5B186_9CNID|nr:NADH dehydrogenase subunit 1 [Kudoa iwatai]
MDRRFLGLVVFRTGIMLGFGFLSVLSDGFKLVSKNPFCSFFVIVFSFFVFGLELFSFSFLFCVYEPGSVFYSFLGVSSAFIVFGLSFYFRGYSSLGRFRSQLQIYIGEGVFSFIMLFFFCFLTFGFVYCLFFDYVFVFSFYSISFCLFSYLFLFHGERHPCDLPESESELGGGLGVTLGGFFFMIFVVMEYRWLVYFLLFCYLFFWGFLFYAFFYFLFRGIFPRYSLYLMLRYIWLVFPIILLFWFLFFVFFVYV